MEKKKILVFGGSFNPPHLGHMEMVAALNKNIQADEIWLLFSQNRFKDPKDYAPLDDRIAMAELIADHLDEDVPLVMSDAEQRLGTNITADILMKLRDENPDCQFIWAMGSDCLVNFHKWQNYEEIINNFPILIVDRKPYKDEALRSKTRQEFDHLFVENPNELGRNGLCFVDNPGIMMSSSDFLKELKEKPYKEFGAMQPIVDYIFKKGLYGFEKGRKKTLRKKKPHKQSNAAGTKKRSKRAPH